MNRRRYRERSAAMAAYYVVLAVVIAAALGPALWVVVSSFKTGPQILSPTASLLPDPVTLEGYRNVFSEIRLDRFLLNTILYALGGTLGALAAGLLAAYPTARLRFPLRRLVTVLFSTTLAIPFISLIVPEFFIMRNLGLFDKRLGMMVFYAAMFFPFSFVVQRAFLAGLPYDIEEAAVMDGAGYFTIVGRIVAPLAVPGLVTVGAIVFIFIWNEYFYAQLLTVSFDHLNVQLALAQFRSTFQRDNTAALAGTTLAMLVPIGLFLFLQRYVISGITTGYR